jgi:hypothetical protein
VSSPAESPDAELEARIEQRRGTLAVVAFPPGFNFA